MRRMDFDEHDRAVLLATPGTFLDKNAKSKTALEIVDNVPQYATGKKLTSDDAVRILAASMPNSKNFIGHEYDSYRSTHFYSFDDPEYGVIRWVIKPTTIVLERKFGSGWGKISDPERVTWAALRILEKIAKRRGLRVLEDAVLGWESVRETARGERKSKKQSQALRDRLHAFALHRVYAQDLAAALELVSKVRKNANSLEAQRLLGRRDNARAAEERALAAKYFRPEDVPSDASAYDIDHPALVIRDTMKADGETVEANIGSFTFGRFNQFRLDLLDADGNIAPTIAYAQSSPNARQIAALARVLRAFGLSDVRVQPSKWVADIGPQLEAGGFRVLHEPSGLYAVPRRNPATRRRAKS